ncbi:glycosyltransferase family 2 protein [Pseudoxanthomonas gei]|uniref:glycosyltransferase family 2 protein n=1 Tax=Pseudoxanthomonas gei TaxID=1383030 RepID=UPI001391C219|nr:glycosyltransferase family 2 protein [Pseudoxanthomonas gei]
MKSIQIVCPVFREEEVILSFHERLREAVIPLRARYTVSFLYVMDPSPDLTESILQQLAAADPEVEVMVMSRRFGHQAALIAGIDACRADAIVMLDSDGQHPPELIPSLVERWEGGAQIVQTLRKDGNETGLLKRTSSAMFYRLLSRIGSIELRGGAADYRLLDRKVIDVLRDELKERNVFLRGLVAWMGFNITFVEFEPLRRLHGASKYRPSILFNFALQGVSSFSKTPLRMCTMAGLLLSVLSVIAGVLMVIAYFLGNTAMPGWASLIAFISLLGGMQLFFMGIIGEYLGQVFDEVKGRPRYLVAKRYGSGAANIPINAVPGRVSSND